MRPVRAAVRYPDRLLGGFALAGRSNLGAHRPVRGHDAYETAEGADALVIATEWNEFRALKLERIRGLLKQPVIIDLRNVYDPQRMKSEGFTYFSVGRREIT